MAPDFDHARFVRALDAARRKRDLSWRQIAAECELTPSTLHRIVDGAVPDLRRFAVLVQWLGVSTEEFFIFDSSRAAEVRADKKKGVWIGPERMHPLSDEQVAKLPGLVGELLDAMAS